VGTRAPEQYVAGEFDNVGGLREAQESRWTMRGIGHLRPPRIPEMHRRDGGLCIFRSSSCWQR